MKSLTEIKAEVDRLAATIGATGNHVLPTYGHTEDFARPHVEVDSRGYHFVVVERGHELERFTTDELDDLLYRVFESVTFSLAFDYELVHRIGTQDCRRLGFQRQTELLSQLSKRWAERTAERHACILREHPFDDYSAIKGRVMYALELKVPPVAIVVVFASAMWLVSLAVPAFQFSLPSRHALALALAAMGACVALSGVISFARAKTTVNPMKPNATTALVVSGIYRVTRNPMYLGFLIALLGWAALLANGLAILFLPGFVLYMNRFQIVPEERALLARFGAAFFTYRARVRRWL
jgi:protein-S-isoprenylcysteine O-methyltransferase Ste14